MQTLFTNATIILSPTLRAIEDELQSSEKPENCKALVKAHKRFIKGLKALRRIKED